MDHGEDGAYEVATRPPCERYKLLRVERLADECVELLRECNLVPSGVGRHQDDPDVRVTPSRRKASAMPSHSRGIRTSVNRRSMSSVFKTSSASSAVTES